MKALDEKSPEFYKALMFKYREEADRCKDELRASRRIIERLVGLVTPHVHAYDCPKERNFGATVLCICGVEKFNDNVAAILADAKKYLKGAS